MCRRTSTGGLVITGAELPKNGYVYLKRKDDLDLQRKWELTWKETENPKIPTASPFFESCQTQNKSLRQKIKTEKKKILLVR